MITSWREKEGDKGLKAGLLREQMHGIQAHRGLAHMRVRMNANAGTHHARQRDGGRLKVRLPGDPRNGKGRVPHGGVHVPRQGAGALRPGHRRTLTATVQIVGGIVEIDRGGLDDFGLSAASGACGATEEHGGDGEDEDDEEEYGQPDAEARLGDADVVGVLDHGGHDVVGAVVLVAHEDLGDVVVRQDADAALEEHLGGLLFLEENGFAEDGVVQCGVVCNKISLKPAYFLHATQSRSENESTWHRITIFSSLKNKKHAPEWEFDGFKYSPV